MDIKEYISSGIIERYVLNTVSPQERQEVECMSHIYPEIKEELTQVQTLIENIAVKSAVTPPGHIKTEILNRIQNETQEVPQSQTKASETKVIPLNPSKSNAAFKYIAAACITGIIILGFYASNLNSTSQQLSDKLKEQESKTIELENISAQKAEQIAFLSNHNTNKVVMNGTEAHPDMMATVFWNDKTDKVMMEVQNLPKTNSDKQYQLWAIVDDQPKDMGVFDMNSNSMEISEMKSIKGAVAFAVTLEPYGGSKSPTMDEMYVIGKV